jgi:hypothetical protein
MEHTTIHFLNSNDPEYKAALEKEEEKEKWEDENGPIEWNPGARIETEEEFYEETSEEYGGWIIDLSKVPPGATHIKVERG